MKKLIIAAVLASGSAIIHAHAETSESQERGGDLRAEMRALVEGEGMNVGDLANLMQERSSAQFQAMDANGDGIVTRDEFLAAAYEQAQGRFERMNPDEQGIVQRSGRDGWGRHRGDGPRAERRGEGERMNSDQRAERRSERTAERFARMDSDGDGMISPQEFEAAMQARGERFAQRGQQRAEHRERRAERRAEMPEEMRQMHAEFRALMREGMNLEAFSGLMQERAAIRFDTLDADGNGELTADEFTANVAERAQAFFTRMDRNNDGVVTSDDRPRWAGKRNGKRD
jgi:Ca2+-binding EF-hand superfamily protein